MRERLKKSWNKSREEDLGLDLSSLSVYFPVNSHWISIRPTLSAASCWNAVGVCTMKKREKDAEMLEIIVGPETNLALYDRKEHSRSQDPTRYIQYICENEKKTMIRTVNLSASL